jgi:hypothetical protein
MPPCLVGPGQRVHGQTERRCSRQARTVASWKRPRTVLAPDEGESSRATPRPRRPSARSTARPPRTERRPAASSPRSRDWCRAALPLKQNERGPAGGGTHAPLRTKIQASAGAQSARARSIRGRPAVTAGSCAPQAVAAVQAARRYSCTIRASLRGTYRAPAIYRIPRYGGVSAAWLRGEVVRRGAESRHKSRLGAELGPPMCRLGWRNVSPP